MSTRPSAWLCALVLAASPAACVSNPTPHPEQHDGDNGLDSTPAPEDRGPDYDNDGVPDCAQNGGVWLDDHCDGAEVNEPTAGADADAGPATGDVDANETDASGGADASDASVVE